jgi:hypothetical protein
MQRVIADAALVVSLGRLHPLVFAANVGTPAIFAEPLAGDSRWPACTKARQMCTDHGWSCADSLAALAARLRCPEGEEIPEALFCSDYRGRWESMAHGLAAGLAAERGKKILDRVVDAEKAA